MTNTSKLTNFDEYANKVVKRYKLPGVALGINKDGERFYEQGFGYRDRENDIPVSMDTVFGIASISKSFTCVGIMQLHEQEKLNIEDSVIKYLPEFKLKNTDKYKEMTIHHFMTNSTGLPPLASARDADWDIETTEDFLKFISEMDIELLGDPGTNFSYSNHCFGLLGGIIERVSGMPYHEYIKKHIFEPAGMVNSAVYLNELEHHEDITKLYETKIVNGVRSTYRINDWEDLKSPSAGAGAIKSTSNDMLKYAEIFRTGGIVGENRVLSAESVEKMTQPYIKISPNKYYGYGLMITPDYFGHKLVEHGGAMDGVASQLCIIPEKDITGIILINLYRAPSEPLLMAALNDTIGEPVQEPYDKFSTKPITKDELKKYVGTYVSNEGAEVVIDIYGDHLTFFRGEAYDPVRYIGDHHFAVKGAESESVVQFMLNENGEVHRLLAGLRQLRKIN